MCIISPIYCFR